MHRAKAFREHAEKWKIKEFDLVIYPGKEHAFHKEYDPIITKWLAREPLPDLPGASQTTSAPINGAEQKRE